MRASVDGCGRSTFHSLHQVVNKFFFNYRIIPIKITLLTFMTINSGSTGKPKGVLHTMAGYMIYAATTFKYVFDYHPGDIYWCTADIGWITGHTYVVYGPLANGATSVLVSKCVYLKFQAMINIIYVITFNEKFEGTPFYPENDRYWTIVDKYKVTQFYTSPTAIRSLIKFGDEFVKKHDLSSLKVNLIYLYNNI